MFDKRLIVTGMYAVWMTTQAMAQSSSMFRHSVEERESRQKMDESPDETKQYDASDSTFASSPPRANVRAATIALERVSMFAIAPRAPRKFKPHDLITVIVRQQKKFESDSELESEKKWNISGKLSEWFRFYDDVNHLGSDNLTNGQPGFKFDFNNKYETEGEKDREDKFTTRITVEIVDVKPNGNLILEGDLSQEHDEESFTITLTGECRSEDISPDNTILSTQIAHLTLVESNKGAVKDASTRGWIPRILDWTKPF